MRKMFGILNVLLALALLTGGGQRNYPAGGLSGPFSAGRQQRRRGSGGCSQ